MDRGGVPGVREIRQEFADRVIELKLPLLVQEQDGSGGELLGDRSCPETSVDRVFDAPLRVGPTTGIREYDLFSFTAIATVPMNCFESHALSK